MKRLIISTALTLTLCFLFGQSQPPVPELLYHKTEYDPTFISISFSDTTTVTYGDWVFAYKGDKVHGSSPVLFPVSNIAVFAQDRWNPGFNYGEEIKLGLYDNETGSFLELSGVATDAIKKVESLLVWRPISLYLYEVTEIGNPIGLTADPDLSEVKITINAPQEFVNDGTLFFSVLGKNTKNIQVITNGTGTITPIKRWITGIGWVNYQYEPSKSDNIIFLNAVGQNYFTNGLTQTQHHIKIIQKDEPKPEPEPESVVKYNGDGYKIVIKPYVKPRKGRDLSEFLGWYFVNTSEAEIRYRVKLYKEDGKVSMNGGVVAAGGEKMIMPTSMYSEIEVIDIITNKKRQIVNQKLSQ